MKFSVGNVTTLTLTSWSKCEDWIDLESIISSYISEGNYPSLIIDIRSLDKDDFLDYFRSLYKLKIEDKVLNLITDEQRYWSPLDLFWDGDCPFRVLDVE